MIRGTTPTFQLKINDETVDLTNSDNVYVTFAYMGWSLTKTGEDIDVSAQQVDVYLTNRFTGASFNCKLDEMEPSLYDRPDEFRLC